MLPGMMMMARPPAPFRRNTRLYSPTFLAIDRPDLAAALERTDKLVVYSGWLHELHDAMSAGAPLVLEVENAQTGGRLHVGILEFSNDQHGTAYAPAWVLHALHCEDGCTVSVKLASLPTITGLTLVPAHADFMRTVPDPRATLEETLRVFTAVTEGQTLVVHAEGSAWEFRVRHVLPVCGARAACLVGADCDLLLEDASAGDDDDAGGGGGAARSFGGSPAQAPAPPSEEDAELAAALAASLDVSGAGGGVGGGATGADDGGLVFEGGGGGGGGGRALPPLRPPSRSSTGSGAPTEGGTPSAASITRSRSAAASSPVSHHGGAGAGAAPEHRALALGDTARGELGAHGDVAYFTVPHRAPGLGLRLTLTSVGAPPPAAAAAASSQQQLQQQQPTLAAGGVAAAGTRLGSVAGGSGAAAAPPATLAGASSSSVAPPPLGLSSAAAVSLSFLPPRGPPSLSSFAGLAAVRPRSGTAGSADAGAAGGAGAGPPGAVPAAAAVSTPTAWGHAEADVWVSAAAPPPSDAGAAAAAAAATGAGAAAGVGISRPGPLRGCVPGWADTSIRGSKELVIPAGHPAFSPHNALTGTAAFYVGVSAFGGACSFSLTAEPVDATYAPPPPPAADAPAPAPSADSRQCDTCGALVPTRTFVMHESFCRRNHVRCTWPGCRAVLRVVSAGAAATPTSPSAAPPSPHAAGPSAAPGHVHCAEAGCSAVLPSADERDKHTALAHGSHACDACGQPVPAGAFSVHAEHACPRRRKPCVYCGMSLLHCDVRGHEGACGGRTVPCAQCRRLVARKHMARHEALSHGLGDVGAYAGQVEASPSTPYVMPTPAGGDGDDEPDELDLGGQAAALAAVFGASGVWPRQLPGAPARPSARPVGRAARSGLSIDDVLDGAFGGRGSYEDEDGHDDDDDGDDGDDDDGEEGTRADGHHQLGWRAWASMAGGGDEMQRAGSAGGGRSLECPSCRAPVSVPPRVAALAPAAATVASSSVPVAPVADVLPTAPLSEGAHDEGEEGGDVLPTAPVVHAATAAIGSEPPATPAAAASPTAAAAPAAAGLVTPSGNDHGDAFDALREHLLTGCPSGRPTAPPWARRRHLAVVRANLGDGAAESFAHFTADLPPELGEGAAAAVQPPPPPRRRRYWVCPCCGASFPGEDDAAVHLLTGECPTPWGDELGGVDAAVAAVVASSGVGGDGGGGIAAAASAATVAPYADPSVVSPAATVAPRASDDELEPSDDVPPVARASVHPDDDASAAAAIAASLAMEGAGAGGTGAAVDAGGIEDDEAVDEGGRFAAFAASAAGAPVPSPAVTAAAGGGAYTCPACGGANGDYEALQLHMLTECPHAAANAASMFG